MACLTVFLELRSGKTVRFPEQIMSTDKYPSIFSRQMKAIVYIYIDQYKIIIIMLLCYACAESHNLTVVPVSRGHGFKPS